MSESKQFRKYLAAHRLSFGLGDEKAPCSMAAVNLFLNGQLTDEVPDCVSLVIGWWVIPIQDAMPAKMRNSRAWKDALAEILGTGRAPADEQARLAMMLDWMWETVLPVVRPRADQQGFGDAWRTMLQERTGEAAAWAAWAATQADAQWAATQGAEKAARAAWAATQGIAAETMVAAVARAAAWTASAMRRQSGVWHTFDPPRLLRQMAAIPTETCK